MGRVYRRILELDGLGCQRRGDGSRRDRPLIAQSEDAMNGAPRKCGLKEMSGPLARPSGDNFGDLIRTRIGQ